MQRLKELSLQGGKVVALAAISASTFSIVLAWTGPSTTAPGNNIQTPINLSSTAQTKTGSLTVGGLTSAGTITVGSATMPTDGNMYLPWAGTYLSTLLTTANSGHKFGGGYGWHASGGYCYLGNPVTGGGCSCPSWAPIVSYMTNQTDRTGAWISSYTCTGS